MLDNFTQWVNIALGALLVVVFVAVVVLLVYILRHR
jgi:hypothetical protein